MLAAKVIVSIVLCTMLSGCGPGVVFIGFNFIASAFTICAIFIIITMNGQGLFKGSAYQPIIATAIAIICAIAVFLNAFKSNNKPADLSLIAGALVALPVVIIGIGSSAILATCNVGTILSIYMASSLVVLVILAVATPRMNWLAILTVAVTLACSSLISFAVLCGDAISILSIAFSTFCGMWVALAARAKDFLKKSLAYASVAIIGYEIWLLGSHLAFSASIAR